MGVLRLCILFLLSACATPVTFDFPNFPNGISSVSLEGDAFIDGQFLRLTKTAPDQPHEVSVGRATYTKPFLLREKATGKLADFTTNFTFIIDSRHRDEPADGLAFFIAPNGSLLNSSIGTGSSLGLPVNGTPQNFIVPKSQYPFVAVEFDIYPNTGPPMNDPDYYHVGIDINSIESNITEYWNGRIANGTPNSAWINYDSSTKNLSVVFTSFETAPHVMKCVYYTVDLHEYLPDRVIVGFSAATGRQIALHKIVSWTFSSTPLVDVNETHNNNKSASAVTSPSSNKLELVIGLSVGGCTVVVGVLGLVWFICRKKREQGESEDDLIVEFGKGIGPRKFSYRKLARATCNFAEGEKLGEGGFGGVYKGFMRELNSYVAVKRISKGSKQGIKEFASEVRIISRLRHRNLVQLMGWCHEKRELLLVYEFMSNGSLDSHLFKATRALPWETRYKIAQDLASGLFYLHEEWEQCVLHRDIKASNVMLDSNFTAKLGDFGLARLVDHGKPSQTTILAGTIGYMAPEYVRTGKASKQSDVYSFGVVSLEIACGRKSIDPKLEANQMSMVEWVWELYGEGKVLQAADPKLCGEFDAKQVECLLIVGLWCAHMNCNIRPSIKQVIQVLNFEVPFPILPSHMSMITTHFAPLMSFSSVTSSLDMGPTESTW